MTERIHPDVLLPARLLEVPYNGEVIPRDGRRDLSRGANCQLFAYALLAANGVDIPDFRSSDLWEDETVTKSVTELAPLDLLLFNCRPEAQMWPLARFSEDPRYAVFIGAKRVIRR